MAPHDEPDPDDDEIVGEVEIEFDPRPEALALHGISEAAFEEALLDALDAYHRRLDIDPDGDDVPDLDDLEVTIDGRTHRLGELADITITATGEDDGDLGDDADVGEEDEDDGDLELDLNRN